MVAGTEQLTAKRVPAVHQGEEVVVVHLPDEAERVGAATEPSTGRLVAVEVVPAGTVDVVGAGVGALERGHPGGHDRIPHERVHSSVCCCDACTEVVAVTVSLLQREGWVTVMPVPSRWTT